MLLGKEWVFAHYFLKTKRKSIKTITEQCFSFKNKSVHQKVELDTATMKIDPKSNILPFCRKSFTYKDLKTTWHKRVTKTFFFNNKISANILLLASLTAFLLLSLNTVQIAFPRNQKLITCWIGLPHWLCDTKCKGNNAFLKSFIFFENINDAHYIFLIISLVSKTLVSVLFVLRAHYATWKYMFIVVFQCNFWQITATFSVGSH